MEPSRYLGGLFYQSAGWAIGQGGWLTHSSAFLERLLLSLFTPTPTKSTTTDNTICQGPDTQPKFVQMLYAWNMYPSCAKYNQHIDIQSRSRVDQYPPPFKGGGGGGGKNWHVHFLQCLVEATSKCQEWKGVPYHLWAKMWHPEDPPHFFWKPKKHVGGVYLCIYIYISCGQVKYFSEISCLTPQNIPGLKGGIDQCRPPNTESIPQCPRGCRAAP